MNEPLSHLLQRLIEGEASDAERTRLEGLMARDPGLRRRHDELARVFSALRSARLEDAPAGLRDDILRSIRGAAPARTPAARTGRPRLSWLRFALPVAAVAVAAVVLVAERRGGPQAPAGEHTTGALSAADPRASLRLGRGPGAVTVTTEAAGAGFRLHVRNGGSPVRLVLEARTEGPAVVRVSVAYPNGRSSTGDLRTTVAEPDR